MTPVNVENGIRCAYCGKAISGKAVTQTGYWANVRAIVHEECFRSKEEMAESKRSCQSIDADCNDCRHFVRCEWLSKGVCSGTCSKTGLPTEGRPNFFSGKECFEQRG